ncbi:MAG: hypothetical protein HY242_04335 [Afipia sp.]|nr:hypothetical protein [Afipia sp.]
MVYRLPRSVLEETFTHFRRCGRGHEECQALWLSSWSQPDVITNVVHPKHVAHFGGFVLDDLWLSAFWLTLGQTNMGIRVQVHTHPEEAFHSLTDDEFPIIHSPGFLSLVIPNFALGQIGFRDAYLTEIQPDGRWKEVTIPSRLVLT